ncbi:ClpXP protease specificity-enhancing factor [Aurantivibrio plasticivorans]
MLLWVPLNMSMTSSRPYMIRALYEWIVDNKNTPYLLVDAMADGVAVPQDFVNKDGQIVLNIAPSAVRDLLLSNESVTFNARFGGVPTDIFVPCHAVLGIYARENGQGMIFEPETNPAPEPPNNDNDPGPTRPLTSKRPSLKVVK